MGKPKRNLGEELLEGIRQIKKGQVGRVTVVPGVAKVREGTGLSQSQFASLIGVSVRTLQDWEQGRRMPSGPAKALLRVAEKNPKALLSSAA